MLRLTFLLCIGMFAALMIAGEDRGQMRPGLAAAAAKNTQPATVAGVEVATAETVVSAPAATEPAVQPAPTVAAADPVAEEIAPVLASSEPEPYVEPERDLVTALEEPVFSLAAVGNERVPAAPAQGDVAPEVADGGVGTIWYVNARSVNVRAEPSTEAEILGRLGSGEATLLVQAVNDDWARIVIQGDGLEGFVAMRYLSAEAP